MNPVSAEQSMGTTLFTSVELKWFWLVMKKQPVWEMGFIQAILLDKKHIIWKHSFTKHQCWAFAYDQYILFQRSRILHKS